MIKKWKSKFIKNLMKGFLDGAGIQTCCVRSDDQSVLKLCQGQKQNFGVSFLTQLKAHYLCLSVLPCAHSALCFAFSDTSDWTSELAGEMCGAHMVADTLNYKVKSCFHLLWKQQFSWIENDRKKTNPCCNICTLCFQSPSKADGAGSFLEHLQLPQVHNRCPQQLPATPSLFGKASS